MSEMSAIPPPPPPAEEKSKKFIAIILLIVIIGVIGAAIYFLMLQKPPTETPPGGPSAPPGGPSKPPEKQEYAVIKVNTLKDLFETVSSMEIKYSTAASPPIISSYTIAGSEAINGQDCWVVEFNLSEPPTSGTAWVRKSDGEITKATVSMGSLQFTGQDAIDFAQTYLTGFLAPFTSLDPYWYNMATIPTDVGVIKFLGAETMNLGPTTLTVRKYRLEYSEQMKQQTGSIYQEAWFAVLPGNKGLLVRLIDMGEQGPSLDYQITSITLA